MERSNRMERWGALAWVVAAAACGSAEGHTGFASPSASRADGGAAGDDGAGADDGASTPPPIFAHEAGLPPSGNGCSDAAKRVYVVSSDRDLYSFWPPTLAFAKVGTLTCDPSSGPFSMAVDRSGTAWVLYKTGRLYRVSTEDASCTPTAFDPVAAGIDKFGMGFSTNGATSTEETLFIAGFSGLARLDTTTLTVTPIGSVSGPVAGQFAELTGTADGRLYGFFYGAPATLNEVDKASAKAGPAAPLGQLATGTAFAFSFWGGDFYLYTANAADTARPFSDVTRFRPADGTLAPMKSQIGFRIVGAGVSTCAPIEPPK